MLPIAGRPAMAYPLELLARAELRDVRVSLYRLADSIEAYFGDGARWGVRLDYRLQREPWGTAGAVKWAADQATETLLVLPCDALVDLDIEAVSQFHRTRGGLATLVLAPTGAQPGAPVQMRASDGQVSQGEPGLETWCFTGACLLEPSLLALIPTRTPCDLYHDLLPQLLATGAPVYGYPLAGYWNALDSFAAYQAAQRVALHSAYTDEQPRLRFPYVEGRSVAPGIWVGRNPAIHPSARLAAPVCLGDDCRVGRDVDLGPDTVVGDHVFLDDEATVERSTILANTYVGRLVNVQSCIVRQTLMVDPATSESVRVTDPHLLAEAGPAAVSGGPRRLANSGAALVLLVLGLPLAAVVGLLTLLATGGRLIRRDSRVGLPPSGQRDAQPHRFALLGFQTRRLSGTTSGLARWIERLELDHLPALWNVLRGELLLVGVRPLGPDEAAHVSEEWSPQRHQWPAGLTGLWYTQRASVAIDDALVADAYYAATRSWREDLRLLWKTPGAWWRRVRSGRERP
jgi:NDP-sugar pyrophosphorylase family protein